MVLVNKNYINNFFVDIPPTHEHVVKVFLGVYLNLGSKSGKYKIELEQEYLAMPIQWLSYIQEGAE